MIISLCFFYLFDVDVSQAWRDIDYLRHPITTHIYS